MKMKIYKMFDAVDDKLMQDLLAEDKVTIIIRKILIGGYNNVMYSIFYEDLPIQKPDSSNRFENLEV